jgi:hypothetical protein
MPGNLQNRWYILFPTPVVSLTTTHFSLFFFIALLSDCLENLKSYMRFCCSREIRCVFLFRTIGAVLKSPSFPRPLVGLFVCYWTLGTTKTLHAKKALHWRWVLMVSCERGNEPAGSIKRWDNIQWVPNWWPLEWYSAPQSELLLKNGVFWVVTPCGSCKNRRFGGT